MKRRYAFIIVLMICFLTGCSKEGKKSSLTLDQVLLTEHSLIYSHEGPGIVPIEKEPDEAGYYPVNDMVYVTSDTLNIRKEPSVESELVETITYGTELTRTGMGTQGWDRISYNGETVYVSQEYLISVPIQDERVFDFSQAKLSIVDTSRQIYSYDSMCEDLMELKENYGNHMQLNVLGTTKDNRNIFEVLIGNPDAKLQLTIVGTMCGTEYMTSLVCMKQLEYYLCYYETGNYKGLRFQDLLERVAIRVIPMLNPDGATISQEFLAKISHKEMQDNLRRWFERDQTNGGTSLNLDNYLMFFEANGNGVDLRKNFAWHFEEVESVASNSSKGFKGDAPATEPEVKAMLHLLEYSKQNLLVVYHTSGAKIAWNFGQEEDVLSKSKFYGEKLSAFMNYEPIGDHLGADANGSLAGYASNVLGVPSLQINLGTGAAPLSLNEFNSIWNACRESWAVMQMDLLINNK